MDTLTITATANGLNYLPEYLADTAGLFGVAGLEVQPRAEAMTRMTPAGPAVASVLAARWPGVDQQLLKAAQAEMAASHLWDTVVLDETAVGRWMDILADEQMLRTPPTDEQLIDARFTEAQR